MLLLQWYPISLIHAFYCYSSQLQTYIDQSSPAVCTPLLHHSLTKGHHTQFPTHCLDTLLHGLELKMFQIQQAEDLHGHNLHTMNFS